MKAATQQIRNIATEIIALLVLTSIAFGLWKWNVFAGLFVFFGSLLAIRFSMALTGSLTDDNPTEGK